MQSDGTAKLTAFGNADGREGFSSLSFSPSLSPSLFLSLVHHFLLHLMEVCDRKQSGVIFTAELFLRNLERNTILRPLMNRSSIDRRESFVILLDMISILFCLCVFEKIFRRCSILCTAKQTYVRISYNRFGPSPFRHEIESDLRRARHIFENELRTIFGKSLFSFPTKFSSSFRISVESRTRTKKYQTLQTIECNFLQCFFENTNKYMCYVSLPNCGYLHLNTP